MGSSESGGNGLVDGSIGTIVWVRRRNGSWWPGKILGADELSASHLMSPRSGTPVKLLGREDASVDWYNLEKSKRVKSFRCGEFDDCIERAEATMGLPSKKREKYARREDAILHALELEKEMLEKKFGKVGVISSIKNNSCESAGKDLRTSSGASKNGNGRHESIELLQIHKVVSPTEDECNSNPFSAYKGVGAWQSSAYSEYNPLIGALQNFTMHNNIGSAALSPSQKAASDDQALAVSSGGVYVGGHGGSGAGISPDRGKGLLDVSVEESWIRRRDRRRPMVQVLQNGATWPDHSSHPDGDALYIPGVNHLRDDVQVKKRRLTYMPPQPIDMMDIKGDSSSQMENFASHQIALNQSHANSFAKGATSGSSEDTESDSDSAETNSMEHYMNPIMATYSDANTPMPVQPRALNGVQMQVGQASTSSEESDGSFLHDTLHFHRKNHVALDMGVTRWLLKGKRNVRSFPRRSTDKLTHGAYLEPRSLAQRPSHSLSYYHDHDGYNNEADFIENDSKSHMEEYGSRGHVWNSQAAPRRCNITGSNINDWEELTWRDRGYWGNRFGGFNSAYGGLPGEELLFDVDLKVQSNHRREHVPFVSLMSRLNGKPIIGHPIQIETLGDGSTDALVSSSEAIENFESDDGNRVSPVWKTSRRTTSFQVPHPHLSSQMDDYDSEYVDEDEKSQSRKPASGNTYAKKNNSAKAPKRKSPHVPKYPSKKPPKRSNLSSSQKIRPLSSIGMDQNLVSDPRHSGLISYMDGVIKPLDSGPPIVACIPVKLVFSRLLEAIGRPPSMPSSHNGL